MMKKTAYFLEAAALYAFFLLCRLLPLDAASGMGGWIGRTAGPRLAASRKALANIELAMPELPPERRHEIVRDMWDNLGRVMAEYPHLAEIARTRVTVSDLRRGRDGNTGEVSAYNHAAFYVSGHCANWETLIQVLAGRTGGTVGAIYRAPNNPWVDRLLNRTRAAGGKVETYSKSKTGTRRMMKAVQNRVPLGLLIDQKYNEGIPVLFFGQPAMTGYAFVQLAQKFDYEIIPCRLERTGGAHFHAVMHDPLAVRTAQGAPREAADVIADMHILLEGWIRERPGQWLWLHRRWPGPEKRARLLRDMAQRPAHGAQAARIN